MHATDLSWHSACRKGVDELPYRTCEALGYCLNVDEQTNRKKEKREWQEIDVWALGLETKKKPLSQRPSTHIHTHKGIVKS
mmetsp:Transcript_19326/g.48112  ORF Transcript_19326/g.48112 Transcript_19326/m.48112 type:complete len:81 (-) Transcript_19326:491-733(-)